MTTLSSILVWRIPWAEQPGRLQSMGSQRVGHDWSDLSHVTGIEKPEIYKDVCKDLAIMIFITKVLTTKLGNKDPQLLDWLKIAAFLFYTHTNIYTQPVWRANSLEKNLMLRKIEGRRSGQQRLRWLDGIIDSTDMSLSKLQDIVVNTEAWHAAVHGVAKSWTWLSDWTTTSMYIYNFSFKRHMSFVHFLPFYKILWTISITTCYLNINAFHQSYSMYVYIYM